MVLGCKYKNNCPYFIVDTSARACNSEGIASTYCGKYKKFEKQEELERIFERLRRVLERNERMDARARTGRTNLTREQKDILTDIVSVGDSDSCRLS